MNRGWLKKSKFSYSSPVVAIRKKHSSLAFAVIVEYLILRHIMSVTWFSVVDQKTAYQKVYLDGDSQPLKVIIIRWGLYQQIKVSFGLTNAPTESQQFMKDWFDIIEKFALPHLDDTTVFLEELNSHHLQIDLKI